MPTNDDEDDDDEHDLFRHETRKKTTRRRGWCATAKDIARMDRARYSSHCIADAISYARAALVLMDPAIHSRGWCSSLTGVASSNHHSLESKCHRPSFMSTGYQK